MDATVVIGPINCQLELDQGVTEFYMDANFAIGPVDWQLEIRPGCHWFLSGHQSSHYTSRLAIRIRPARH